MSVPPVRSLDYAAPPARRRSEPARRPSVVALINTLIVSAFLMATGGKINPGGPFISIHADIVPALISVGLVAVAWRSLRHGPLRRRLAVASIMLCAAAVLALDAAIVVSFWLGRYSRRTGGLVRPSSGRYNRPSWRTRARQRRPRGDAFGEE